MTLYLDPHLEILNIFYNWDTPFLFSFSELFKQPLKYYLYIRTPWMWHDVVTVVVSILGSHSGRPRFRSPSRPGSSLLYCSSCLHYFRNSKEQKAMFIYVTSFSSITYCRISEILFGREPLNWEIRSKDRSRLYPLANGEQKIGTLGSCSTKPSVTSILQTINSSCRSFNNIVTNLMAGHKITEQ